LPTDVLQITPANIKEKKNPTDEAGLFRYGTGSGYPVTEAYVLDRAKEQEDLFLSSIPEKYRRALREIEGEIIVRYATDGQTTAQLGLFPVTSGTVELYLNFGKGTVAGADYTYPASGVGATPYSGRIGSPTLMTLNTDYTVNTTTGAVTFLTALGAGDTVHADYAHTAAYKWLGGRFIVIARTAINLFRDFPFESEASETYDAMEEEVATHITNMWGAAGQFMGIDLIDRLKLAVETRATQQDGNKLPVLGAW
jgi:hypothetical protein